MRKILWIGLSLVACVCPAQKLLGVSKVIVPLYQQNRTPLTYTAIWESIYQPSYPPGALEDLSGSTSDVTVEVLPSN